VSASFNTGAAEFDPELRPVSPKARVATDRKARCLGERKERPESHLSLSRGKKLALTSVRP
jgi:hypothetical protein